MTLYTARLQERRTIAEGTMAFHFEKPEGFVFKPGQALEIVLGEPDTASSDSRHAFSIVSAPFQNELAIATRMRDSAFKRALQALPVGAPIVIDGPFGSLGLHKDHARAAVFIAGGIGITPFMSMLRQAAHDQRPQDVLLLYSNHRPEDAAFLAELLQLEQSYPRLRLIGAMTQMGRSALSWNGRTARFDSGFVRQATAHLPAPIFYVAGPPGMVEATRQLLAGAQVDEDDIRSEEFYGY